MEPRAVGRVCGALFLLAAAFAEIDILATVVAAPQQTPAALPLALLALGMLLAGSLLALQVRVRAARLLGLGLCLALVLVQLDQLFRTTPLIPFVGVLRLDATAQLVIYTALGLTLACWQPPRLTARAGSARRVALVMLAAAALPLLVVIPFAGPLRARAVSAAVLQPRSWVAGPLPALQLEGEPLPGLRRGTWVVLFIDPATVAGQVFVSDVYRKTAGKLRVHVLVVTAAAGPDAWSDCDEFLFRRLARDRQWVFETPLVVRVADGQVTAATDDRKLVQNWLQGDGVAGPAASTR